MSDRALTLTVIKSGLVTPDVLTEIRRWGLPLQIVEESKVLTDHTEIVNRIREALEGEDLVETRDTDLDILRRYLEKQKSGRLHISDGEETTSFPITYCITDIGSYVLPWRSEGIKELMTNGRTYLHTDTGKIYFQSVSELFFGEHKAFMVGVPAPPIEEEGKDD
jgi:hypothetical protein